MMTGPSWAQSAPDHQFGPAFFLAKCGNPQLVDKRLVVVLDQFFFRFLPFAGVHVRNDVLILCNQVYSFPLKQLFHNMNNLQEHNLEYQLIFLVSTLISWGSDKPWKYVWVRHSHTKPRISHVWNIFFLAQASD